jgi:hypothetical protein
LASNGQSKFCPAHFGAWKLARTSFRRRPTPTREMRVSPEDNPLATFLQFRNVTRDV